MLLAVDIGNTNISFGIFTGEKLIYQFDIETKEYRQTALIKKLKPYSGFTNAIICSVVPALTGIIKKHLKLFNGINPQIIGKTLKVPIKNYYRLPKQVGQDRLVDAYAAGCLYPAPLVVIDSGTAITFDVISKDRAYLGGLIFPGMNISLAALKEKTALLPKVKLSPPKTLIGRDTKNSILNGVVLGTAALSKELTEKIKKKLGRNTQIIGTGGNISLIKKYSGLKMSINRDLTLIGIKLIYKKMVQTPGFRKNS